MKCDLSHREEYSASIMVLKTTLGILGYFGIYFIVACAVAYVLF